MKNLVLVFTLLGCLPFIFACDRSGQSPANSPAPHPNETAPAVEDDAALNGETAQPQALADPIKLDPCMC